MFTNQKLTDLMKNQEIRELKTLIAKWITSFESTYDVIYSDVFNYTFESFYAFILEWVFNVKKT